MNEKPTIEILFNKEYTSFRIIIDGKILSTPITSVSIRCKRLVVLAKKVKSLCEVVYEKAYNKGYSDCQKNFKKVLGIDD